MFNLVRKMATVMLHSVNNPIWYNNSNNKIW